MNGLDELLNEAFVRDTLLKAGWSPSRAVDTHAWRDWYEREGYSDERSALDILRSFGGLRLRPPMNEAADFGSGLIEFDPIVAATGESDRIRFREQQLGEALWPIGEWCEVYILLLGASGAVYAEAPEYGVLLLGPTFGAALRTLITGVGELRDVAEAE